MKIDAIRHCLSRAVTAAGLISSDTLDDDLRAVRAIGATFVGRAADYWQYQPDEPHFAACQALAGRVHAIAPGIVLQGCIFEAIFPGVAQTPIPAWVFEAFNLPVETRNFRWGDLLGPTFGDIYHWGQIGDEQGSVPDLTQLETQMWFYYRAVRYLQSGFEALHLGQVHMYAGRDRGYRIFARLCAMIRAAATRYARRGFVMLDAHTHGIAIDGQLLFDFCSRPISARNYVEQPERIILVQRGQSIGGILPGGESCDISPTLIEVDNWGGYSRSEKELANAAQRAQSNRWGYDDIAWFAHQPLSEREHFMQYAHRFVRAQHDHCYFQMPLRRTLGRAAMTVNGCRAAFFKANNPSPACPDGFGGEDAIARIWRQPLELPRFAASIDDRIPATGQRAPQPVAIVGPIQQFLGGLPGDASCPWSRLTHTGHGRFEKLLVIPWRGTFDFTIACGGTMTEVYRSGLHGGKPYTLTTTHDNAVVHMVFDYADKSVTLRPLTST